MLSFPLGKIWTGADDAVGDLPAVVGMTTFKAIARATTAMIKNTTSNSSAFSNVVLRFQHVCFVDGLRRL